MPYVIQNALNIIFVDTSNASVYLIIQAKAVMCTIAAYKEKCSFIASRFMKLYIVFNELTVTCSWEENSYFVS